MPFLKNTLGEKSERFRIVSDLVSTNYHSHNIIIFNDFHSTGLYPSDL